MAAAITSEEHGSVIFRGGEAMTDGVRKGDERIDRYTPMTHKQHNNTGTTVHVHHTMIDTIVDTIVVDPIMSR